MQTGPEALWNSLLALAGQVTARAEEQPGVPIDYCTLQLGEKTAVAINDTLPSSPGSGFIRVLVAPSAIPSASEHPLFTITTDLSCDVYFTGNLAQEAINFLQLYLPYCFLPIFARKRQRAIAIAHFAQTLDGRIAASNGDSKWIGNPENLIHAHRMRALCDGIMVGANTVDKDHPRLTVRHVKGKNPCRIVVSSSKRDMGSLLNNDAAPVWVIGTADDSPAPQCQYIQLHKQTNGKISPMKMLKRLYQNGINSVYVEGGPQTTSYFLEEGALDVVQIHISPMILGSGMPGFSLPQADSISQAIQFEHFSFHPIGNTFMFAGTPKAG